MKFLSAAICLLLLIFGTGLFVSFNFICFVCSLDCLQVVFGAWCVGQAWRQWLQRPGFANLRAATSRGYALVPTIVGISAGQRGLTMALARASAFGAYAQSTVFDVSFINNIHTSSTNSLLTSQVVWIKWPLSLAPLPSFLFLCFCFNVV